MKKIFSLLFFISFFVGNEARSQGYFEVFGLKTWAIPQPQFSDKGWGMGMDILSSPVTIFGKNKIHPINFQFGPGFYASGLGGKKFSNVPLLAPQTGSATVKLNNIHLGTYGLFRFSSENKNSKRIFYLDFLSGLRYMGSNMAIIPKNSSQTDTTLKKISSFMCGVGAGMQMKLAGNINFDFELIWTYAARTGDFVNLKSAQQNNAGISFDTESAPNSIMLLKVGFYFPIKDSENGSRGNYHSGGSSSTSNGGHSSVHVSSGGGHSISK